MSKKRLVRAQSTPRQDDKSIDDCLGLVKAGHYSTEYSVSRKRLVRAQRTPWPR